MSIDPNIAHEARSILGQYTSPVQELIKQNLYGPREARLAGAIVANLFTVVVTAPLPSPEERLHELQGQAYETVTTLCKLLRRAMVVIEESVAGQEDLVRECDEEIACAEDNIFPPDESEGETKELAACTTTQTNA
jgi:hypothetical protein